MFVKICGVSTIGDVETAVSAGADAIGFVLTPSPRRVDVATARQLAAAIPSNVLTVAVASGIPARDAAAMAVSTGLRALQLHGDYPPSSYFMPAGMPLKLIRATALTPRTDVRAGAYGEDMLLLDSPVAGSGQRWDLSLLGQARPRGHWLLAGGLTPDNVATAIATARPWGVDVSSGVESERGVKDRRRILEFVANARAAGVPADPA